MIYNKLMPMYDFEKCKFWQRVRNNQVTDYQCFILTKTLYIPSTKPMWMNLCYNIVTRDVQLTS